jgi:hypothetical protein
MASENLWGDLPDLKEIRTPASILKEQGTRLTEMTNGVLRGKTTIQQSTPGRFTLELRMVASALQGYEYTVVKISHGIDLYPLTVSADISDVPFRNRCENEGELLAALKAVLTSEKTRAVMTALLAQSKIFSKPVEKSPS